MKEQRKMEIHRFISDSVAEGLIGVREELGADAMILSVQEDADDATSKMGVEILAVLPQKNDASSAIPPTQVENLLSETPTTPNTFYEEELLADLYANDNKPQSTDESRSGEGRVVKTHYVRKMRGSRGSSGNRKAVEKAPAKSTGESQERSTGLVEVRDDFDDHYLVKEAQRFVTPDDPGARNPQPARPPIIKDAADKPNDFPPKISSLYFYLLDTGINPDIAEELVVRLTTKYNVRKGWNKAKLRNFLGSLVANQIRTGGTLGNLKKRRVIALVGPTGVGKTTTVAKLAAILARRRVTIGLITIDHFRVGAFDHLRKFADILSIPILAANNNRDFMRAIRAFRNRQVTLIDTTGQNPRDYDLLHRLNETLKLADNLERHLVLAAPTKERDLLGFVEMYRKIGFNYLLFSKLDETATYGGLLNTHFAVNRPFSYFATGQRVPEDIEEATSARLNELLFN